MALKRPENWPHVSLPRAAAPGPRLLLGRCLLWIALLTASCLRVVVAVASDDDEDPVPPELRTRPGLVARYVDADGAAALRVDRSLSFDWGGEKGASPAAPDQRLAPGAFRAAWAGKFSARGSGRYRFCALVAGKLQIAVGGKTLLDCASPDAAWHLSEPVEFTFDDEPLELRYDSAGAARPRLFVAWEGDGFPLEPLPVDSLIHRELDAPPVLFEDGRRLVRELRCGACHALEEEPLPAAPSLAYLDHAVERSWLTAHLAERFGAAPKQQRPDAAAEESPAWQPVPPPPRKMPRFALAREEADAIAAHLYAVSATPRGERNAASAPREGNPEAGRKLFFTVGCAACHRVDDPTYSARSVAGRPELLETVDLGRIGEKRPPHALELWLERPEILNPAHRMPLFPLAPEERADLAAFLSKQTGPVAAKSTSEPPNPAPSNIEAQRVARGQKLFETHRCASCHRPAAEKQAKADDRMTARGALPLVFAADENGCLGEPAGARPGFSLTQRQRSAVREYLAVRRAAMERRPNPQQGPRERERSGHELLSERNCLGCHQRTLDAAPAMVGAPSLVAPALVAVVAAADRGLETLAAEVTPPALDGAGDKFHAAALAKAISAVDKPRRAWLTLRMPKFPLAEAQRESLAAHFIAQDRLPEDPPPPREGLFHQAAADGAERPAPDRDLLRRAGRRLVTADGFGCASCHTIGSHTPKGIAPNARGPDLLLPEGRLRRSWYERFVREPQRVVPRMEMPSIRLPVRGVLGDNIQDQVAAVWEALSVPGFTPPVPGAVRVVRGRGESAAAARPVAIMELFDADGHVMEQPLVVGLPNGHNGLLDLGAGALARWWIGDTARQRTQAKSWYWEPGGRVVWPTFRAASEVVVTRDGRVVEPLPAGQFVTEVDALEYVPEGLVLRHRLRFPGRRAEDAPRVLGVEQMFHVKHFDGPLSDGFHRELRVRWLDEKDGEWGEVALRLALPLDARWTRSGDVWSAVSGGNPLGQVDVAARLVPANFSEDDPKLLQPARAAEGWLVFDLDYRAAAPALGPADKPPGAAPLNGQPASGQPAPAAEELDVLPGYRATRLPLDGSIMPTAFAWRSDGSLLFTTLKGQLFVARDTDGDGLEDSLTLFADGLAVPYGMAMSRDGEGRETIDVIHKDGLLRLIDLDGDDRADRIEKLASGWGHTTDYHDWAVGLPRDAEGNYYVSLPCQQDDRSAEAARLRGHIVKLVPREPTPALPARYEVQSIASGMRFAMGLALHRSGALFATDNQGNYTPFNELNQIIPGSHYGFVNKREQQAGFTPPPTEPPAVAIPHPWTRSVNGVAFLERTGGPAAEGERKRVDNRQREDELDFGPFTGQLVGCEYDTRRLVRMSLEQVGDVWQGAVYPFTYDEPKTGPPMDGPIVCAVSPRGALYVGNIRDSGWGGGANTGSIVHLVQKGQPPPGIAQVRAQSDGFVVEFTAPVDRGRAARVENYAVESYARVATPAYGGPDVGRRRETIESATVDADGRSVRLKLGELRTGHVYELRAKPLAAAGQTFFPSEAHYTLRARP